MTDRLPPGILCVHRGCTLVVEEWRDVKFPKTLMARVTEVSIDRKKVSVIFKDGTQKSYTWIGGQRWRCPEDSTVSCAVLGLKEIADLDYSMKIWAAIAATATVAVS